MQHLFQFLKYILWGPQILFYEMEKRIGNGFFGAAPCLGGEEAGACFWAPWLLTGMALGRRGLEGERGFPAPRLLAQEKRCRSCTWF